MHIKVKDEGISFIMSMAMAASLTMVVDHLQYLLINFP